MSLKEANVNIHVIATGAGAGLQERLWATPGCSAYFSGATFPYAAEEQEEVLGFMPEHFCSKEAAVDLASAAYMKAYRFGGKAPIGVGITATVASEEEHKGDHRFFACLISNDQALMLHRVIDKGKGEYKRYMDGKHCDSAGFFMIEDALKVESPTGLVYEDVSDLAKERFFARPFFGANGQRLAKVPFKDQLWALMPGAYNPPHEGHIGVAEQVFKQFHRIPAYEITAEPPHKDALTVQQLLQRAKLLHGGDRLFTRKEPFYLDKARVFPGVPLVLGADAVDRIMDPKWGLDVSCMLKEFEALGTKLYVAGRLVDGKWMSGHDIIQKHRDAIGEHIEVFREIYGRWDISSTEIRNKQEESNEKADVCSG
jgi:nicotinamide mononucleotide (NMN) deamidase PncC